MKQLFVNQVFLGDNHQTLPHAEQTTDVKVLARLRHHAFIRGDDQGDQIDPMRAGQHVLHKALVPGHIDKANLYVTQIEIGKTNVDRNTSSLFFRQPIRINARQRAHQRSLAVIDMSRRADDD